MKTKLERDRGTWVEELPNMLWSFRTTPREAIRETPFSMVYRVKTVLPVEFGVKIVCILAFEPEGNGVTYVIELGVVEEE